MGNRMRVIFSKADDEKEAVASLNMLSGLPYEFMSFDFGDGHPLQEVLTVEALEDLLDCELQSESMPPNRLMFRRR
ncbi:MAG: hypothetical protein ACRCX2_08020 [Paraclostridium sp.]